MRAIQLYLSLFQNNLHFAEHFQNNPHYTEHYYHEIVSVFEVCKTRNFCLLKGILKSIIFF